MSSPEQPPAGDQQTAERPKAPARTRRERLRGVSTLVLAILATVFAVLNLNSVKVDWIVGSGHAPLIVVIAVSLLVGVVLGHFAERRVRRRR